MRGLTFVEETKPKYDNPNEGRTFFSLDGKLNGNKGDFTVKDIRHKEGFKDGKRIIYQIEKRYNTFTYTLFAWENQDEEELQRIHKRYPCSYY